jgi:hypothetical protein
VAQLHEASGLVLEGNQGNALVPWTVITSTTCRHSDKLGEKADTCDDEHFVRRSVDARVGFLVLESNPDAYFDHGDVSIPIEKGSFIHFDGGVPHNTVIKGGYVKMIGPMDLKTFCMVGSGICSFPFR